MDGTNDSLGYETGRRRGNRRRARLLLATATVLAAAGAAVARVAAADTCSECPKPTSQQVREAEGGHYLGNSQYYYEIDGGECAAKFEGPFNKVKRTEIVVWSAYGTAVNCPGRGKIDARVSYTLKKDSQYEWRIEGSAGVDVGIFEAALRGSVSGSEAGEEIGTVDYTISAPHCHRTQFTAWFVSGDFVADLKFSVSRRYHWWVKDRELWSSRVYAQGDIWQHCGYDSLPGSRLEPIGSDISTRELGCEPEDACGPIADAKKKWFPPLPPGFDPPPPPSEPATTSGTTDEPKEADPDGAGAAPGSTPEGGDATPVPAGGPEGTPAGDPEGAPK